MKQLILKFKNKDWDWEWLLRNKIIDYDFIESNFKLKGKEYCKIIRFLPLDKIKHIERYCRLGFNIDYGEISYNKNVTPEFIENRLWRDRETLDSNWDWTVLSKLPQITFSFIKKNRRDRCKELDCFSWSDEICKPYTSKSCKCYNRDGSCLSLKMKEYNRANYTFLLHLKNNTSLCGDLDRVIFSFI